MIGVEATTWSLRSPKASGEDVSWQAVTDSCLRSGFFSQIRLGIHTIWSSCSASQRMISKTASFHAKLRYKLAPSFQCASWKKIGACATRRSYMMCYDVSISKEYRHRICFEWLIKSLIIDEWQISKSSFIWQGFKRHSNPYQAGDVRAGLRSSTLCWFLGSRMWYLLYQNH